GEVKGRNQSDRNAQKAKNQQNNKLTYPEKASAMYRVITTISCKTTLFRKLCLKISRYPKSVSDTETIMVRLSP
ncbi:hypothetical protein ACT7IL_004995, partial [Escherichia coli]